MRKKKWKEVVNMKKLNSMSSSLPVKESEKKEEVEEEEVRKKPVEEDAAQLQGPNGS